LKDTNNKVVEQATDIIKNKVSDALAEATETEIMETEMIIA